MMATRKSDKGQESLKKKVHAAFSQCEQEGTTPSVKAIHGLVGGSYSDLCPAVREVKAELKAREAANAKVPEMPQAVGELFESLWHEAFTAADAPAAAARRSFEAELSERNRQLLETEEMLVQIETEREQAMQGTAEAEKRATSAEENADDLITRISELEVKLRNAQDRLEDRSSLLAELRSVAA